MEGERTHQEGFAFFRKTGKLAVGAYMVRNFNGFQNSMAMGSGRDTQWAVGLIAVVQMKADDQQLV